MPAPWTAVPRARIVLPVPPRARRLIPATALLLATAGCADGEQAPAPRATARHVVGGFLRDPEGRALLLRGLNLSGRHEEAPYFDFQQPPDYERVSTAWGMNAVRFLLSWAAVEPAAGVYDDGYLDQVALRMEWARRAGLQVVLDMHQDVYGEGFASGGGDGAPLWSCDASHYADFVPDPTEWFINDLNVDVVACYDHFWHTAEVQGRYVAMWRHVAARLAGYDDVIAGFDPMNEPVWGSYPIVAFEADLLQPFYEQVVAAVRAERPGWVAFLEPAASRNLGIPTGLHAFSFPDVVYAPHSYDRNAEMGMGFAPGDRAGVLSNAAALATEAAALGAGLWVGEYGARAGTPGVAPYMDAEYDAFAAVAAGTTYWCYGRGGSYDVLDAAGNEKPELMAAIVRPWPERVAGDPVSYGFDTGTRTFTLSYRPDPSIAAPTVVRVPQRVYPNGYTVSCDGCVSQDVAGGVWITQPPRASGGVAVVKIAP